MAEANPARTIIALLQAARQGAQLGEDGNLVVNYSGGPTGSLRHALMLQGAGAYATIDALTSIGRTLDWLLLRAEALPQKKQDRAVNACNLVKAKLDWEFGDRQAGLAEPGLNFDVILTDFDYFAMELEATTEFEEVDAAEIDEIDRQIVELEASIAESGFDRNVRELFLDIVASLKSAVRNLRRFGAVACEERLKDALGRIGNANFVAPPSEEKSTLLQRFWSVFVNLNDKATIVKGALALPKEIHDGLQGASDTLSGVASAIGLPMS